ncbi:hypothetical protein BDF22DRAFT_655074 [Syncephalis plumigaleata]|nr:hypothetical protein BDF22DRAFT_655074 [Syncephalis plumigaleata]
MESSADNNNNNSQPIVNATTSISSNSPGISIIIIIIDTSQHTNHEADEEHWIDYIYVVILVKIVSPMTMEYTRPIRDINWSVEYNQSTYYHVQQKRRRTVCYVIQFLCDYAHQSKEEKDQEILVFKSRMYWCKTL